LAPRRNHFLKSENPKFKIRKSEIQKFKIRNPERKRKTRKIKNTVLKTGRVFLSIKTRSTTHSLKDQFDKVPLITIKRIFVF
jgi:hypothetical protein